MPKPYKRWLSFTILLFFSFTSYTQNISLSLKNASLEKAFREIESRVEQRFVYTREMLQTAHSVTVELNNMPLQKVLEAIFENQPLAFAVDDRFIKVKYKPATPTTTSSGFTIRGKVFDEKGDALSNVTITSVAGGKSVASDNSGAYTLTDVSEDDVLHFSSVGYKDRTVSIKGRTAIDIHLALSISQLDEAVIIAYGTTTQRLSTGNVARISSTEIAKQPVSNPLAALQGRVPGLLITQSSGIGGSGFSVQIRGQNSIIQGSEPLFILDGVPFAPGNNPINQLTNATNAGGLSPLNLINPADIESVEILKDADATAIYGSRGANGVVLITTKKGKAGTTKVDVGFYSGTSRVTRTMNMLNTQQYVEMRKEAFINDGVAINLSNAPDILLWDTTRNTDLKKLLIGGTANISDGQLTFSGGMSTTQFLIGGGLHRETTVFPTELGDQKASAHFNINHNALDNKLSVSLSGSYVADVNKLLYEDPTGYIALPPNLKLYDSVGNLAWQEGGVTFASVIGNHPLANLYARYRGSFQNLVSNLRLGYKLSPGIAIRVNVGYNTVSGEESQIRPSTSIDPNSGQLPFSYFTNSNLRSWIIEPQLEYSKKWANKKLTVLLGSTVQENVSSGTYVYATNYTSDLFLNSITGAGAVIASNNYNQYRYDAFFGRINFNWKDRYLLTLSGRQDASSRFGPQNRSSNFGALGAAWLFTGIPQLQRMLSFLSYGKIRGSYGITGNDQIGDYRYIDTWAASATTYQGISILNPTALFNPNYGWETNKKIEAALELGFLKDRFLLSTSFYRNRSGNQIVQYTLPIQTGFSSIGRNLNASVQNQGVEFVLTSKNIVAKEFNWSTNFNISFTKNSLLSFPGLATSSYATRYVIGEPLNIKRSFQYTGIDNTGIYQFTDVNKDGKYDNTDRILNVNTDPSFYGGMLNSISFKNVQVSLFIEFRKQRGLNYFKNLSGYPFGTVHNQPILALSRWQKAGDVTDIQRFTATFGSAAYRAGSTLLPDSDAAYSNASFVRFKNISIAYDLPAKWLKLLHIQKAHFYVHAQNLFTLTPYKGSDPENQSFYSLPPLRTITGGIQVTL